MDLLDWLFWLIVIVACGQQFLLGSYQKQVEKWESMFRELDRINDGHIEIIGKLYSRIHDIPYNSQGQLMERSELDRQSRKGETQEETIEDIIRKLNLKKDQNG